MTVDIICADARDALARFPDGHFHCCISSPPFWGLRDYGLEPTVWGGDGCEHEWGEKIEAGPTSNWDSFNDYRREGYNNRSAAGKTKAIPSETKATSQGAFCRRCNAWRGTLGLEPTPELYVEHLVGVMRMVRRVLRPDATLWLNIGDSYGSGTRATRDYSHNTKHGYWQNPATDKRIPAPAKQLFGMPWRVAFALQADGWWLRSDIIWSKPNPMPESVTDRPTRSHEYLFLLTKRERYAYDQDAIREPHSRDWSIEATGGLPNPNRNDGGDRQSDYLNPAGRNRRSVWEIATQPYAKAHFATFPEKLVEPCILAGTSEWGCCPECGAPWERVVERNSPKDKALWPTSWGHRGFLGEKHEGSHTHNTTDSRTTGWWPTCKHGAEPVPCRVLDPFAGSGTVGLVAERLGRHSVLIDAKEEYCLMARHRTAQRGLMVEAAT